MFDITSESIQKCVNACVIQKLKDRPLYTVIDIQQDISREYGVNLSYKQAWLGKEVTQVILNGSELSSYDLLL